MFACVCMCFTYIVHLLLKTIYIIFSRNNLMFVSDRLWKYLPHYCQLYLFLLCLLANQQFLFFQPPFSTIYARIFSYVTLLSFSYINLFILVNVIDKQLPNISRPMMHTSRTAEKKTAFTKEKYIYN